MLVEKFYFYVRLLVLLLVVATEGKKKKNKKKDSLSDDPLQDPDASKGIKNLCDIPNPQIIYCYCNTIDPDKVRFA